MCPLLGMDKALLLDTGDLRDADKLLPRTDLPLAQAMYGILAERQPPLELIIVHTHSHYLFWDGEFSPATVVGHDHRSIMEQFGLSDWPDGRAVFDLGGRPFDVFPTPGRSRTPSPFTTAMRGSPRRRMRTACPPS